MPKSSKTFTTLFVVAGMCLCAGVYCCIAADMSDPLGNSPILLVVGACFIGVGLTAGYLGAQSFRHYRAVIEHITRRDERRVRVRKRRTPRYGEPEDSQTPEKL
jgi:F0F1-type ATP synthase membrane subunit c/vacuolar-type H+-ATPase subunit K